MAITQPTYPIATSDLVTYLGNYTDTNSANAELGYAERTTDFTTASLTMADVTGLSVTVTVGTRPIVVEFFCSQVKHAVAGGLVAFQIVDEAAAIIMSGFHSSSAAGESDPVLLKRRLAPTAGTHTYKVQACTSGFGTAGTSTITGGTTNPSSIQVVQV